VAGLGGVVGLVTSIIGSEHFMQILSAVVAAVVVPLMVVLKAREQGGFM